MKIVTVISFLLLATMCFAEYPQRGDVSIQELLERLIQSVDVEPPSESTDEVPWPWGEVLADAEEENPSEAIMNSYDPPRPKTNRAPIWVSVAPQLIGTLDFRNPGPHSFLIPDGITARRAKYVIVYVSALTGDATYNIENDIKVSVKLPDNKEFAQYLYMKSYAQQALNTNSDNMLLPMPADRKVTVSFDKDTGLYSQIKVQVVGYIY